jgi:hypothetical protein
MAASSGVFAEEIGVPGMTDNTVSGDSTAGGGDAGGDDGGGGGEGHGKAAKAAFGAAKGAFGAARGKFGRGKYTEKFSGGGLVPQLEESDVPLLTFAIVAILISLLCD